MKNLFLFIMFLMSSTLIFYSCKEDVPSEINQMEDLNLKQTHKNFFDWDYYQITHLGVKSQTNSKMNNPTSNQNLNLTQEVFDIMDSWLQPSPLFGQIVSEIGFPIWSHSWSKEIDLQNGLVIIPFAKGNSNQISAIFRCNKLNDEWFFKLLYVDNNNLGVTQNNKIMHLKTKEFFNKEVFNHSSMINSYDVLYINQNKQAGNNSNTSNREALNCYEIEVCECKAIAKTTSYSSNLTKCPEYHSLVCDNYTDCSWETTESDGGIILTTNTTGGSGSSSDGTLDTGESSTHHPSSGTCSSSPSQVLGDYASLFDFDGELAWLSSNCDVLQELNDYIQANGGVLDDIQQQHLVDHVWLSMNYTGFNNEGNLIGSDGWMSSALEVLSTDYGFEWELNPNIDPSVPNTQTISELLESLEFISDEGSTLVSEIYETNLINNTPKGSTSMYFDILETNQGGWLGLNNEIHIDFNYDGFPNQGSPILDQSNITIVEVEWDEETNLYTNPLLWLDVHDNSTIINNQIGNPVNPNAQTILIHMSGIINRGIQLTEKYVISTKTDVILNFYLETSDGNTWLDINNPRFLNSSWLHVIKDE